MDLTHACVLTALNYMAMGASQAMRQGKQTAVNNASR